MTDTTESLRALVLDRHNPLADALVGVCQRCYRGVPFDYHVVDEFWLMFVPEQWRRGVICLPCLAAMAEEQHGAGDQVHASILLIYFSANKRTSAFAPVSLLDADNRRVEALEERLAAAERESMAYHEVIADLTNMVFRRVEAACLAQEEKP